MVTQPAMLQAQLKDYQMRGLSWLAHLYESGINGILADEMGLGKVSHFLCYHGLVPCSDATILQTIQSISLLAWLAETHNIWGPFLVVAPTSTVHNWQAELSRFVPRLKVLPHWGTPADREVIRRQWSRPSVTFTEDAPFHIVVTSYDMVGSAYHVSRNVTNLSSQVNVDTQYFKKVRWQYMILDEAQAVKNAGTQRWTNLLSLKSRNRLLLTGTPIQNNMGGKSCIICLRVIVADIIFRDRTLGFTAFYHARPLHLFTRFHAMVLARHRGRRGPKERHATSSTASAIA